MVSEHAATPALPRRRVTLDGFGSPGPIEERLGRRLVRLVDPDSEEGRRMLREGDVELIGPEGDSLGTIGLDEASARLRRRLEESFEAVGAGAPRAVATRESGRLGRS